MKLSNVLKVFGTAALLGSLIPYRVSTDEDTGEKKYRALLWEATQTPQDDGEKKSLSVHVGFFNPLADDEAHLYADDLTVEYIPEDEDDEIEAEEEKTEETAVDVAESIAEEAIETAQAAADIPDGEAAADGEPEESAEV